MKKLTALLLLCSLLLTGCGTTPKEPVTFYYLNTNYEEDMSSAIGSELREASGHREDLTYLLALYLMGPAGEDLVSPLPDSTTVLSVEHHGSNVTITLSEPTEVLTDAQFTMACSCLTLTCLELTTATNVTIKSGDHAVTLDTHHLLLQDLITADKEEFQ